MGVMYYSPCGTLFTSRAQVEKFLGLQPSKVTQSQPRVTQSNRTTAKTNIKMPRGEKLMKDKDAKNSKHSVKHIKLTKDEKLNVRDGLKLNISTGKKVKNNVVKNFKYCGGKKTDD